MDQKPVYLHGCGVISPLGDSSDETFRFLGRDLSKRGPMSVGVSRIVENTACDLLTEKGRKRQTRVSEIVLECTRRCLVNSEVDLSTLDLEKAGMMSGSVFGSLDAMDATYRAYHHSGGRKGLNPVEFSKATYNFPISSTMLCYGMKGPSIAMISHSSVAMDSIANAVMYLQEGIADTMIVVLYEDLNDLAESILRASNSNKSYVESCVSLFLSTTRPSKRNQNIYAEITGTELYGRARKECEQTHVTGLYLDLGEASVVDSFVTTEYRNLSAWMGNHLSVSPAIVLSLLMGSEAFRNSVLSNVNAVTDKYQITIGVGEHDLNRADLSLKLSS